MDKLVEVLKENWRKLLVLAAAIAVVIAFWGNYVLMAVLFLCLATWILFSEHNQLEKKVDALQEEIRQFKKK